MDNIFDPIYRSDYYSGYTDGQNPFLSPIMIERHSEAFNTGFTFGRLSYERLNGPISKGIPPIILTDKILEEFLLAGMLGMHIDYDGFTDHQLVIISQWYESGVEKYDPNQNIYLLALLERNGIVTQQRPY